MDFLAVLLCCLACLSATRGCGSPTIKPVVPGLSRIVGGSEAVPHSWPWQVSLQTASGYHFCGASLINESWAVTAAHCGVGPSTRVVLGSHDLLRNDTDQDVQVAKVEKVFPHPFFNKPWLNINNDIALIQLSSPVVLGERVSPVCLAETSDNFTAGTVCVTSGWGETKDPLVPSSRLQQVAIPLITNEQCKEYYGAIITDEMLCAGASGASVCFGDSGGPLVCQKDGDGPWTLLGVTSFTGGYCSLRLPSGFARVTELRDWIDQTMIDHAPRFLA